MAGDEQISERNEAPREAATAPESNAAQQEVQDSRATGTAGSGAEDFGQIKQDTERLQNEGSLPSVSLDGGPQGSTGKSGNTGADTSSNSTGSSAEAGKQANEDKQMLDGFRLENGGASDSALGATSPANPLDGKPASAGDLPARNEAPLEGGSVPQPPRDSTPANNAAPLDGSLNSAGDTPSGNDAPPDGGSLSQSPSDSAPARDAADGGSAQQDRSEAKGYLEAKKQAHSSETMTPQEQQRYENSPIAANAREFADSMKAMYDTPAWQTGGVEERTKMLNDTSNNFLDSKNLPPTSVSSQEMGNGDRGSYSPSTGGISIDSNLVKQGGAELASTVAHELNHHEQQNLKILTALSNAETGQVSFADRDVLQNSSPELVSNAIGARQGQPLSADESKRGNQLLDEHFERSGEATGRARTEQLQDFASKIYDGLRSSELKPNEVLQSLSDNAADKPLYAAVLNHPQMNNEKQQMEYGQGDKRSEFDRRESLAGAMDRIVEDSSDSLNKTYGPHYKARLDEKEAWSTGKKVGGFF